MPRRKAHIQADIDTTQAWMRITGTPDWKLVIEDLCARTFFQALDPKDQVEAFLQMGEQRLLRRILSQCSPALQQSILNTLTEEVLTDGY